MKSAGSTSESGSKSPSSPTKKGRNDSKSNKEVSQSGVELFNDKNGIPQLLLQNSGASVTVSLLGGQVLSWKKKRTEELLFVSKKAIFDPPKAVRGGIPICFPQFGNSGTMEQHGFARNRIWIIENNPPQLAGDFTEKVYIDLLLKPYPEDAKIWPHNFQFRLRVSLAADGILNLTSRIRNVDSKNFSFSIAYHTYLSVSDISEVRVEGLETQHYLDNLLEKQRFTEQGSALTFESEVDRIYTDSNNVVAVMDHQKKRTFMIRKDGLPDVVVWNPWERKSKSIVDLGNEEYKQMVCVDGAAVENPITLKPGEEWTGRLELSLHQS